MNERERGVKVRDKAEAAHVGTSIFDAQGQLKYEAARMAHGDVSFGEYLHLDTIPWAPEPDGPDHCQHLARVVEYMAQLPPNLGGLGPFEKHEQKVLHAVAMLYAVGKGNMGRDKEPAMGKEGYEQRSANFASKFFHDGGGMHTYWARSDVREDVCRLLLKHNDEREIKSDKRLQVLHDGLRYELVRLAPNTGEGLSIIREQCRPELFFSGWAQTKQNFTTYMAYRGWNV